MDTKFGFNIQRSRPRDGFATKSPMSVLAEALSVLVPVKVLRDRYPGGVSAYESAAPNRQYCADDSLTRMGFMSPSDVGHWINLLTHSGLEVLGGETKDTPGNWHDCAVVDQFDGPTRACTWLEFAKSAEGFSFCWLAGTEPGPLATPPGIVV